MKFALQGSAAIAALAVAVTGASLPDKRGTIVGTAVVDLSVTQGTPKHLASGFIYGIPDNYTQIPSEFYTGMGFNYARAGGARLPAPARGWLYGEAEFQNRFASALANYKAAREYGATFQLLVSDLWGYDETGTVTLPGANGNWTSYDLFLDAVFAAIRENDMEVGLEFEIFNEPDLAPFTGGITQYLNLWGRTFPKVRAAFPSIPIVGPSTAVQPSITNKWWSSIYPFFVSNGSVPDAYTWHEETGGDDITTDIAHHNAALSHYGAPAKRIVINEYGTGTEQAPGSTVWFISRLERNNVAGLRGNWRADYSLHDFFANLLGKPGALNDCTTLACYDETGYFGNGEYNVYSYYAHNMTGLRAQTTASGDGKFDVYATTGTTSSTVKVLAGSRYTEGTWNIQINNLTAVGLPTSGSINIHTWGFPWNGNYVTAPPKDLGTYSHAYSNNSVTFWVNFSDTSTAFAFEFV